MSMAIAYQVKKRANKMAKGGAVKENSNHQSGKSGMVRTDTEANQNQKGVNQHGYKGSSGGTSQAGAFHRDYGDEPRMKESGYAKQIHKDTLSELRSMPKPNLKGLADGGMVGEQSKDDEADMISRIMKKRFSQGGEVANDTPPEADFKDADYDFLAEHDGLDFHDTAANSGDEDNDHDIVARIMRKKRG